MEILADTEPHVSELAVYLKAPRTFDREEPVKSDGRNMVL